MEEDGQLAAVEAAPMVAVVPDSSVAPIDPTAGAQDSEAPVAEGTNHNCGVAEEGEDQTEEEEEGSEDEEESDSGAGMPEGDYGERLAELLRQADAYSAQITGGTGPPQAPKKGQSTRSHLLTEKEEDDLLLQAAQEEETAKGAYCRLTEQPACIAGQMKAYQVEGLNWLYQLFRLNINGILADEMGLGKTLQCISLLGFLKYERGVNGPHLIICPRSTLDNWYCEINKWCSQLRAVRLHGTKEQRDTIFAEMLQEGRFDLCVTTYEMVIKEKNRLSTKYNWEYLVMDEAHRIKNEKSILADVVRRFRPNHRLLITGTPLQNNLRELWSLLNFIMPQLFDNTLHFEGLFDFSRFGSSEQQQRMIQTLHRVLRPFMLRRLKTDVARDLPPKREVYIFVGMSKLQKKLYADILSKNLEVLNAMSSNKTQMLNILMQLRKCCNHPYLFDGVEPGPPYVEGYHLVEAAGKMHLLDRLLPRLKAEGSRVLLFSQMTRLLDIVDDYCRWRGHAYCRIDGSTPGEERQLKIDDFNREGSDKFIFLLSTRAGGLGINLATADVVILFDSDFNPQMDLQAMDRAHRIGQKKKVVVYRFVTGSTVEERIVERAAKKLKLDSLVIQKGRLSQKGSQQQGPQASELQDILQFGAQEVYRTQDESSITEADIDIILADAEQRTAEIEAQLQSLESKFDLSNISLDGGLHMYGGDVTPHQPGKPGRKKGTKTARPAMFLDLGDRKTKWRGEGGAPGALLIRKERRLARRLLTGWRAQIHGGYDFQFFDTEKLDALDAVQTKWTEYLLKKRHEKHERRQRELELEREQQQQQQQQQEGGVPDGAEDDGTEKKRQKIDVEAVIQQLFAEAGEETAATAATILPASDLLGVQPLLQAMEQAQQAALASLLEGDGSPKCRWAVGKRPLKDLLLELIEDVESRVAVSEGVPLAIRMWGLRDRQQRHSQERQQEQLQEESQQQPKKRAGRPRKARPPEPEECPSDTESALDDPNDPDRPQPFTAEMKMQKEQLLSEGFLNWNRTEFTKFVSALIHFGRDRLEEAWQIHFSSTNKTIEDLRRYADVFFQRYLEVEGGDRIMQRIERAEELRGAIDLQRRAVQAT
ncbi:ISWI chromatin-remodeling complex ATPase CHR17, partial [Cyclospora cayetanensis]|uniref:ISWI chromatin-remodeling complex ATPase CHR17 n=1 Tax=Cyclospora cayetanensis TaxID=88456 RepID=A0A6P6S3H1_9EIME